MSPKQPSTVGPDNNDQPLIAKLFANATQVTYLFAIVWVVATAVGIQVAFDKVPLLKGQLSSPEIYAPIAVFIAACSVASFALLIGSINYCKHSDKTILALKKQLENPEHLRLVRTKHDLYSELYDVIDKASQYLVVSGSRSRDPRYLQRIRDKLTSDLHVEHYVVLYGPPRSKNLEDHLRNLFATRPALTERDGVNNLHVVELPSAGRLPERFICASEKKAVIPIQSCNRISEYDTALVLTDPQIVAELASQFKNIAELSVARKITKAEHVSRAAPYESSPPDKTSELEAI